MEVTVPEPPTPEADSVPPRPWMREPQTTNREEIMAVPHEETPTEPGYGHGV
jgi:hypothetical protein